MTTSTRAAAISFDACCCGRRRSSSSGSRSSPSLPNAGCFSALALLSGGRLLPTGGGARDLWGEFIASWHPVGIGAGANAPPYLAVLALFATILFGKAWLAVDLLMLGGIPLAGLMAYLAAGRVTRETALRVWAAATYALLPVATGAVATGRLGDVVAFICIPPLLVSGARLVRTDPGYDGWRHVGVAALLLAVATAFAPVLYLIALPGSACGHPRGATDRGTADGRRCHPPDSRRRTRGGRAARVAVAVERHGSRPPRAGSHPARSRGGGADG